MTIAVLGAGNVGATLGKRFAQAGRKVVFGVRDPHAEKHQETRWSGAVVSPAAAIEGAQAVLLALPWAAVDETLTTLAPALSEKIIIDATNPINASFTGLDSAPDLSAGERVARLAPNARIVKAFNTIGYAVMADPVFPQGTAALAIASDDDDAKAYVMQLSRDIGLVPYDAGPLTAARSTEAMAWHWIDMAVRQKHGPTFAFAYLER